MQADLIRMPASVSLGARPIVITLLAIFASGCTFGNSQSSRPVVDWRKVTIQGVSAGTPSSQIATRMGRATKTKGDRKGKGGLQIQYANGRLTIKGDTLLFTGTQVEYQTRVVAKIDNDVGLLDGGGGKPPGKLLKQIDIVNLFGEAYKRKARDKGDEDDDDLHEMIYRDDSLEKTPGHGRPAKQEFVVSLDGNGSVESFSLRWDEPIP